MSKQRRLSNEQLCEELRTFHHTEAAERIEYLQDQLNQARTTAWDEDKGDEDE